MPLMYCNTNYDLHINKKLEEFFACFQNQHLSTNKESNVKK